MEKIEYKSAEDCTRLLFNVLRGYEDRFFDEIQFPMKSPKKSNGYRDRNKQKLTRLHRADSVVNDPKLTAQQAPFFTKTAVQFGGKPHIGDMTIFALDEGEGTGFLRPKQKNILYDGREHCRSMPTRSTGRIEILLPLGTLLGNDEFMPYVCSLTQNTLDRGEREMYVIGEFPDALCKNTKDYLSSFNSIQGIFGAPKTILVRGFDHLSGRPFGEVSSINNCSKHLQLIGLISAKVDNPNAEPFFDFVREYAELPVILSGGGYRKLYERLNNFMKFKSASSEATNAYKKLRDIRSNEFR